MPCRMWNAGFDSILSYAIVRCRLLNYCLFMRWCCVTQGIVNSCLFKRAFTLKNWIWIYQPNDFFLSRERSWHSLVVYMTVWQSCCRDWRCLHCAMTGKSVCTVVTTAKWEWFQQWKDERVKKRGEDYDATKTAIARRMWEHVVAIYPQLADKVIRPVFRIVIRTPSFSSSFRNPSW